MDLKRVAKAMPWIVGIGLCLVEALKLVVLLDSANRKNAGTGHTEPFLFAPAISRDWNYITGTQMWVLGVALSVVLLLAALMLALNVWVRSGSPQANEMVQRAISTDERAEPKRGAGEAPKLLQPPPDLPAAPARTTPSGRKPFGRAQGR